LVVAHDVNSFVGYFNRFKGLASLVYADEQRTTVVGVIDHDAGPAPVLAPAGPVPGWRSHRVTYTAPRSKEWLTWTGMDGKAMTQEGFAQFIEDNVVDIREPAGADVLEMSRTLEAKKAVSFTSSVRLSDGMRELSYQETSDGATTKGNVKLCDQFTLGIPVFQGGQPYAVVARLRYRIKDAKLVMFFELFRPSYILADAFQAITVDIATRTETIVLMGVPG
jgi:uncharacterized protein YfdQ (DUF2303 family)